MVTSPLLTRQQRGVLAVVGAFLLQLVAGSYNGTFGNLLPYLTSYLRQSNEDMTNGDLAMIFALGGLVQGFGFLLGGTVLVPVLGARLSLVLGCLLYTLSPVLTYLCLVTSAGDEAEVGEDGGESVEQTAQHQ